MTKNNFPVISILIIFSYWIFCSGKDTITKKDLAGKPVQDGPASTIPTKFNYILVMACPSPPTLASLLAYSLKFQHLNKP